MSRTHTVTFSRLRANFTVDKEILGKQDPYVIFTSGSAKAQTKAIKGVGTGTAEWKESYSLEEFSPSSSSVIEVTVYNHNTLLPDSVIGAGTIDLSSQGQNSLSGQGEPVSVVLTDRKGQEVGTLQFLVNGGGYTGRGATSGSGVGSGTGVAGAGVAGAGVAGAGVGSHTGSHTGVGHTGSGVGSHTGSHTGVGTGAAAAGAGAGAGSVVGKGLGSDQRTAQQASDAAAREGREVTIEDRDRVGVGHPASGTHGHHHGTHGTGTHGTGVTGSHTGVGSDTTGTRGLTGTGTGVATGERAAVYGEKEGDVIDRKYYVGTESRPQDQALVEQYREHNPYAKDYETTVQHTGRERLVNSQIEALGTRERVVGQDHHVHAHPHHEIARNLPAAGANIPGVAKDAGAINERPGGEGWVQTKPGPVCDTNTFSITGDRTVDKERVTDLREHRDFEKEFEVKTRLVGERALDRGTDAEILNRERVLVDEKNKIACEGHPTAGGVSGPTLADQRAGTGMGSGTGYGSGTGVGTGTGSGYGSGVGTEREGVTGTGVGSGTGYGSSTGTGTGVGSGTGYGSSTGTGTGVGSGTGYGSSTGTGTGVGSGTGYGSGTGTGTGVGSGTGYGSGTGATGHGTGTGRSTLGEKAAGFIPGTEENQDKKHGYQPGQGPQQNAGNVKAGEKAASFIPGTEENREKKAGQYA